MRSKLPILCAILIVPVALWAEPRRGDKPERPEKSDRPHPGRFDGERPMRDWQEKDWNQFREKLAEFCKAHSPNRWADIERSGRPGGFRAGGMAMRFGALQQMKEEDPTLYKLKVQQIEVEDREYGLLKKLKEEKDTQKIEQIKQDLRTNAQEYVSLGLQERAHRISRLEHLIVKQKEQLARDQENPNRLIDDRVQKMLNEGVRFFFPTPGAGRRDGEGGSSTAPTIHAEPVNANP